MLLVENWSNIEWTILKQESELRNQGHSFNISRGGALLPRYGPVRDKRETSELTANGFHCVSLRTCLTNKNLIPSLYRTIKLLFYSHLGLFVEYFEFRRIVCFVVQVFSTAPVVTIMARGLCYKFTIRYSARTPRPRP